MKSILFAAPFILVTACLAEDNSKPLIEEIITRTVGSKKTVDGKTIESVSKQKRTDCLSAIGDFRFCQCIADFSPVAVDFVGYIQIATSPKEKIGYDQVDKETKEIIDAALKAKSICQSQKKRG